MGAPDLEHLDAPLLPDKRYCAPLAVGSQVVDKAHRIYIILRSTTISTTFSASRPRKDAWDAGAPSGLREASQNPLRGKLGISTFILDTTAARSPGISEIVLQTYSDRPAAACIERRDGVSGSHFLVMVTVEPQRAVRGNPKEAHFPTFKAGIPSQART